MATASSSFGRIDPLLEPFVRCTDERRATAHLERIIRQYAEPMIWEAVRGKQWANGDDAVDILGEAVRLLLERIAAIRYSSAHPIKDFLSYTRITVRRLCWKHRQTFLIERDFFSFETGAIPTSGALADAFSRIEQRNLLETVWREIRELPTPQRMALLCNFRDRDGSDALPLLAFCSITTPKQLAQTFGISEDELENFVERLPMADSEIATMLDLTTREVINQRSIARRRLKRRTQADSV